MPIRPENKDRYPTDWPEISRRVREDAENKCEKCGVVNGANIHRCVTSVDKLPVWRVASWPNALDGMSADDGKIVPGTSWDEQDWGPVVRVVLTVAHLDHQPENCERENLRAWCQRCHNQYDAPTRRRGINERKRAQNAISDLFT